MIDIKKLRDLTCTLDVLYVEDDPQIRESVGLYLKKFFKSVQSAADGAEGLEIYKKNIFDIVVTDIEMPKMTGLEMSSKIKKINPEQNIIIISAYSDSTRFIESILIGIDGYIIKPINFEQMNNILHKIVNNIIKYNENENYRNNLEEMIKQKTKTLELLQAEKINDYDNTLVALVDMIERRDSYTGGHSKRVAEYAKLIAKAYGYEDEYCSEIYKATILHDIGKIAIPDSVLLKPGKFNKHEMGIMKNHVVFSEAILKKIPGVNKLAFDVSCHHERVDGSGYPRGLKGDEIPVVGTIVAISDTFDAMTTNRIYKGRKDKYQAIEMLKGLSGSTFDTKIVNIAVEVLKVTIIDTHANQLPKTEIEKERFSYYYKDQVTLSHSESYLELILGSTLNDEYSHLVLLELRNFNNYNQKHGWDNGNILLMNFSKFILNNCENSLVFRVHGDDFVILSRSTSDNISLNQDFSEVFIDSNVNVDVSEFDIKKDVIRSINDLNKKN